MVQIPFRVIPIRTGSRCVMQDVKRFEQVLDLIRQARYRTLQTINRELIELYWQVGEYIHAKIVSTEWGKSVVAELSRSIKQQFPDLGGFSDKNLWRMKHFYEAYYQAPHLSTLLREIPWSAHLHILAKTKRLEEKEFYLRITIREKYSVRELERQLNSGLFERTLLADQKLPTSVRTLPQDVTGFFRDSYVLEFLNPPAPHSEKDLRQELVQHLKNFILEAGKGFAFVGESYRLQVGNTDFFIDLLLYHRMLQCLVAIELKVVAFEPAHLGQLNFYLEALDRDHRLPHENPSIGVLLCASKDEQVVEYALSRSLSPTLVADYHRQLIDKHLLEQKLNEFYALTIQKNRKKVINENLFVDLSPLTNRTFLITIGQLE